MRTTMAEPATAAATWQALGTTVRVVVTDPSQLDAARDMLTADLRDVDQACSRFRPDSEIRALQTPQTLPAPRAHEARTHQARIRTVTVSQLLAEAIAAALRAAQLTDGDVDPTVGAAMNAVGYDRDFTKIRPVGPPLRLTQRSVPGWQSLHLEGTRLTIAEGIELDLGATAKAWAADRSATAIAATLNCGVLISLGGDIAVSGPPPQTGWRVRVQDVTGDPEEPSAGPYALVTIRDGGLATSSTRARRWRRGGDVLHHILDPRTSLPAEPVWRTVSVAAGTCADANAASTAAIIRGRDAITWLAGHNLPARLVDGKGAVFTVAGWPDAKDAGERA
jgi:thiamine biosynthesis lipoprotein ApbE